MAKAQETNNQYLDAAPTDFSERVQALLATEREAYEILKEAKKAVLCAVKAEMQVPAGREVKHTAYTRWGQWQIVVGDKVAPVAKAGARQSLADYLAEQAAGGRSQ